MKYIKSINEYLSPEKNTIWFNKTILKDVHKMGIIYTNVDSDSKYLSFVINDHSSIKKVMNILRYWKNYCLEKENLILVIGYINWGDDIKFIIHYKTLKIKRVNPLPFVYHRTHKENLDSILKNGLIPKDSSKWMEENKFLEYPPAIFANNINIKEYPKFDLFKSYDNDYITLKINTTIIKNKWFYDLNITGSKNYIMTFDPIPPNAIEVF